jgi:electron transfer flavoprotein alpha subunit
MAGEVLVLAEHWKGELTDASFESLAIGRELAEALGTRVHALLAGHGLEKLAGALGSADKVFYAESADLAEPNSEILALVVAQAWRMESPRCLLVPITNVSWDVLGMLPGILQAPFLNFCRDARIANGAVEARCLLYGGKIEATVLCRMPVILGALPGIRPAENGRASRQPEIETLALETLPPPRVRFRKLIEPQEGDVDIARQPVLVSVGRGIQTKENLEQAEELAAALGGVVCGSRPVIDQGWLPLSRQVGKSGATVKPRVYLALGISGAPEHVEGMKDSELIIAVNTDPHAPIFDVAHFGVVGDAVELMPALMKALAAKKA